MRVNRYYSIPVLILAILGSVASMLPPQVLETYPGYEADRNILDIIHPRSPGGDSPEDSRSEAAETEDGLPQKLARQFLGSWFYPADASFSREAQQDMKELLLTENIASNWVEYEQLIKSRFLDQWRYLQKVLARQRLHAPARNQVWNLRRSLSRVYYQYRSKTNRELKKAKIQFHQRTVQSKLDEAELVELQKTTILNLKANLDKADVEFRAKIDELAKDQDEKPTTIEPVTSTSTTREYVTSTSPRTFMTSEPKQIPPERQQEQQAIVVESTSLKPATVDVIREAVAEEPRPCDAQCQSKCGAIVSNLRLEIK